MRIDLICTAAGLERFGHALRDDADDQPVASPRLPISSEAGQEPVDLG
jgi:hypothetical protein